MTTTKNDNDNENEQSSTDAPAPNLHVAPSPHFSDTAVTTRRMMIDVLIGLVPAMGVAMWVFRWHAAVQVGLCVISCLVAEFVCSWMRGRRAPLGDVSALVTGVILGLSLPALAPPYIPIIAGVAAIGLGKAVFGGLGYNLFNPAMVGRAFVMLSFAAQMGATAYVLPGDAARSNTAPTVLTQATPLTVAKQFSTTVGKGSADAKDVPVAVREGTAWRPMLLGNVNGSLGETSALALLIGGLFLCARRSAAWEIPFGVLLATCVLAQLCFWAGLTAIGGVQHLLGGAAMFGAFFIATDPVSSPLTPRGKFLFGVGIGLTTVLIRVFGGYSEGLMFAVLLMNACVPLINRWIIPAPLGGLAPQTESSQGT